MRMIMTRDTSSQRDARQGLVYRWAKNTFGDGAIQPTERATRFLEEAIELAQAQGIPIEEVKKLVDYVYAKPPGDIAQEVGGCGVTLLAFCAAVGLYADEEERNEVRRVLAKDPSHFQMRQNIKAEAGIAIKVDVDEAPDNT